MTKNVVLVEPTYIADSNSWIFLRQDIEGPNAIDHVLQCDNILHFPQICACCGEEPNKKIFTSEINGSKWPIPYCNKCSTHLEEYNKILFPNIMKSRLNRIKSLLKQTCVNMGSVVEYKGSWWIDINKIKNSDDEIPPLKVELKGEPKIYKISKISAKFPLRLFHQFIFYNKTFADQFAIINNGYVKDHYYELNRKTNTPDLVIVQ